jgi:anti-sigma regulatory factor (Ser/Thr protein kinase)
VSQWRARLELPIERTSPAAARHIVGTVLQGWHLEQFHDDLAVMTSELVTNVYVHTPKADSFELELIGSGEGVRLSIADGYSIKPVIKELDPDTPTGRGLRIVQALASRWGSEEHAGGKRVWVELDRTTSANPTPA